MLFIPPRSGAVDGEADTGEAAARQPPDLLENKTVANDTESEILTRLISSPTEGDDFSLREVVACPVLTQRFTREVLHNPIRPLIGYLNYGKCRLIRVSCEIELVGLNCPLKLSVS